jgi:hypothetical protein
VTLREIIRSVIVQSLRDEWAGYTANDFQVHAYRSSP